jgi:hypothetical protein
VAIDDKAEIILRKGSEKEVKEKEKERLQQGHNVLFSPRN